MPPFPRSFNSHATSLSFRGSRWSRGSDPERSNRGIPSRPPHLGPTHRVPGAPTCINSPRLLGGVCTTTGQHCALRYVAHSSEAGGFGPHKCMDIDPPGTSSGPTLIWPGPSSEGGPLGLSRTGAPLCSARALFGGHPSALSPTFRRPPLALRFAPSGRVHTYINIYRLRLHNLKVRGLKLPHWPSALEVFSTRNVGTSSRRSSRTTA